ncbi:hypothetical protein B0H13DRAFT_1911131 [Mycena leptocephala]|nr:hypothetical protein B0H13DRAFT_1911131 [Mycena leptocephala]
MGFVLACRINIVKFILVSPNTAPGNCLLTTSAKNRNFTLRIWPLEDCFTLFRSDIYAKKFKISPPSYLRPKNSHYIAETSSYISKNFRLRHDLLYAERRDSFTGCFTPYPGAKNRDFGALICSIPEVLSKVVSGGLLYRTPSVLASDHSRKSDERDVMALLASILMPFKNLQGYSRFDVVPSFKTIAALVSLFAFFAHNTLAQTPVTAVTLWQFGQGRLLEGQTTLPLQPLGTARDGSATTYLYEVLNKAVVNTVVDGSFTTQTIASPATRTIIASASGWVEPFGTAGAIACGFIGPNLGSVSSAPLRACKHRTPFAQVLQVAAASPTFTPSVSHFNFHVTRKAAAGGSYRRRGNWGRGDIYGPSPVYRARVKTTATREHHGRPGRASTGTRDGCSGRKGDTSDLPTADWVISGAEQRGTMPRLSTPDDHRKDDAATLLAIGRGFQLGKMTHSVAIWNGTMNPTRMCDGMAPNGDL